MLYPKKFRKCCLGFREWLPNINNKERRIVVGTSLDTLPTGIEHIPELTIAQYIKLMNFLNESTSNLSV